MVVEVVHSRAAAAHAASCSRLVLLDPIGPVSMAMVGHGFGSREKVL
jgi:hypothetical protein